VREADVDVGVDVLANSRPAKMQVSAPMINGSAEVRGRSSGLADSCEAVYVEQNWRVVRVGSAGTRNVARRRPCPSEVARAR
jgi:hypothetical protein